MESPTPKSAASAPSSPVASPSSNIEPELTPRSKVRALLALSDDSDFDTPRKSSSTSKPKLNVSRVPFKEQSSESDGSDSDVAPRKPIGRTVARLLGKPAGTTI